MILLGDIGIVKQASRAPEKHLDAVSGELVGSAAGTSLDLHLLPHYNARLHQKDYGGDLSRPLKLTYV